MIDRQEAVMDVCGVVIVAGIAASMAGRAGRNNAVNTEEHMVDTSVGVNTSVAVLVVYCVRSENGVAIIEAHVDIASIGCKSSGVCLTVDCAGSTDIVDGVEPAIGEIFTGIIS